MDWQPLLVLDLPWIEIFARGSLMYLGVFTILRIVLKREIGSVGIPDLLLITMIADAAQNGMAGEYRSVPAGLLLVLTLVFWNFVLDWMTARFAWFERITRAKPLRLVSRGTVHLHNLKLAGMSRAELAAQLREQGIEKVASVKAAYLESDGKVSVIER